MKKTNSPEQKNLKRKVALENNEWRLKHNSKYVEHSEFASEALIKKSPLTDANKARIFKEIEVLKGRII